MKNNKFQEELKNLPALPGVYFMKDETSRIIYVGKAINLKRRVSSYFQKTHDNIKTEKLVAHIHSFEIFITDTELEALILECKMIKLHKPQYNTLMKNDWRYPYIKITNEYFPQIITVPSPEDDGAEYFGPYKGYEDIERILRLIKKLWGIRSCPTYIEPEQRKSPCLNFHIKQCKGPCDGNISLEEYSNDINYAKKFLNGNYSEIMKRINKEMKLASKEMFFEKAAVCRDNLHILQIFVKRQKIILASLEEKDMFIFTDSHTENKILVFMLRFGRILDKTEILRDAESGEVRVQIEEFLQRHYTDMPEKKREIEKSEIDEIIVIQGWLHHTKAKKISFEIKRKTAGHSYETAVEKSLEALQKLIVM